MKHLSSTLVLLLIGIPTLLAQDFKVVGYLPNYRFSVQDELNYSQLTHLNFAFLNPDSQGNWEIGTQSIDPIVIKARTANPDIRLMVAMGGGSLTPEWSMAWKQFMKAANRSAFIHSLIQYLEAHDLNGVDMDLEWNDVDSLYSPFVIELADSLHAKGYLFSAAWPGTTRYADISDSALAVFDWVNLMAYDLTGPWQPGNSGPHSPYSFAQQSISYWLNQGLPAHRIVLGVPFYGRSWDSPDTGQAFTYAQIVAEDTSYAYLDQVGQRYYNGIPTIQAKTQLAHDEGSGIMIWELGQDALGSLSSFSLLEAIDEQVQVLTSIEPPLTGSLRLYPNPATDFVEVEFPTNRPATLRLFDIQGRVLREMRANGSSPSRVSLSGLAPGLYSLYVETDGLRQIGKIVKR